MDTTNVCNCVFGTILVTQLLFTGNIAANSIHLRHARQVTTPTGTSLCDSCISINLLRVIFIILQPNIYYIAGNNIYYIAA